MAAAEQPELTLFLWLEGFFPRRIIYLLFAKGLVASAADLLSSPPRLNPAATAAANVNLRVVRMRTSRALFTWSFDPADEAHSLPRGATSPCLRVRHPSSSSSSSSSEESWVYESSAIASYLDELYPSPSPSPSSSPALPPLLWPSRSLRPLDAAAADDRVRALDLAALDAMYYMKHASPAVAASQGLRAEQRSREAALEAKAGVARGLARLQDRCFPPPTGTGSAGTEDTDTDTKGTRGGAEASAALWLTPGTPGPGLVDFNLASARRYFEVAWGWDIFGGREEGEEEEEEGTGQLRELAAWYERLKAALPFWEEWEGRADVHPEELRFGREGREC